MAKYDSVDQAVKHHEVYPDLRNDLKAHDFQRRRVGKSAEFVRKGDVVLDVACNAGYFKSFVPQAKEVHGVDVQPELIEVASKVLDSCQFARAESLPFPDKRFDVVNVSGLLEQVFDPLAILKEAARVSRRSVVGNTVHHMGTWGTHRIERHQWQSRSYSEEEIRGLLEQIGTITNFGTIDINTPPEPQCWWWCVYVDRKATR